MWSAIENVPHRVRPAVVVELLESASMTRLELYDLTGVPASTITRLLKDEREFDVRALALFCAELGVTPSELIADPTYAKD